MCSGVPRPGDRLPPTSANPDEVASSTAMIV
jgi:hypothetical protein